MSTKGAKDLYFH